MAQGSLGSREEEHTERLAVVVRLTVLVLGRRIGEPIERVRTLGHAGIVHRPSSCKCNVSDTGVTAFIDSTLPTRPPKGGLRKGCWVEEA